LRFVSHALKKRSRAILFSTLEGFTALHSGRSENIIMTIIKDIDLIAYQLGLVWFGALLGTVIGFWLGVLREKYSSR
jgi:hypothetical protein